MVFTISNTCLYIFPTIFANEAILLFVAVLIRVLAATLHSSAYKHHSLAPLAHKKQEWGYKKYFGLGLVAPFRGGFYIVGWWGIYSIINQK